MFLKRIVPALGAMAIVAGFYQSCGSDVSIDENGNEYLSVTGSNCEKAGSSANKKYCYYMISNHKNVVLTARDEYERKYGSGGACALTQSTGLEMAGVVSFFPERPASTLKLKGALVYGGTHGGVNYGASKGWRKVSCSELKAGDIVLTKPKDPQDIGQINYHSFMFVQWVSGSNKTQAWSIDYHNPRVAELEGKAYKRWIKVPAGSSAGSNPFTYGGNHLCDHGLRATY